MKEKFYDLLDFIGGSIRKIKRDRRGKRLRLIVVIAIFAIFMFFGPKVSALIGEKIYESRKSSNESESEEAIIAEEDDEESIIISKEEPELEIDAQDIYYDIEKYFSDIQQALRENPQEAKIEGLSLRISQARTIVVDGEDLKYNVDCDEPKKLSSGTTNDGTWICYAIFKMKFFVPKNYKGELHNYKLLYMDTNGKIYNEYIDVPYIRYEDLPRDCIYKQVYTIEENGKKIPMYAPYTFEYVHYIEKFYFGESLELHMLDIPNTYLSASSINMIENDRILITNEDILGVFDIKKNMFSVISTDVFEIRKTNDYEILFTDSNHDLYWCNWKLNSDAILVERSDIK